MLKWQKCQNDKIWRCYRNVDAYLVKSSLYDFNNIFHKICEPSVSKYIDSNGTSYASIDSKESLLAMNPLSFQAVKCLALSN